ncbi:hypothetical protein LX64_04006 [Chitinophaga skermanii]|uniref:Uncharacterized protein n=1 Tax=Chitinophaga skermanii TaxID=331697 RepID=A0A327Q8T5_9BACT|nr:hypothetical protein [Chitinophaga skermanii]RAJ00304.1 hypothetical protein LX64_04006 [Chitinophaga skermanii]
MNIHQNKRKLYKHVHQPVNRRGNYLMYYLLVGTFVASLLVQIVAKYCAQ